MSAMAKAQKGKAEAFMKDAEALLTKKGWFTNKEKNQEEAAETYEQAANAYKIGGLNQEAGDAYMTAAGIYRDKLSSFNEASKCLNNAGEWKAIGTRVDVSLKIHQYFIRG
jgi:alpha-soluble NSF attachment protein